MCTLIAVCKTVNIVRHNYRAAAVADAQSFNVGLIKVHPKLSPKPRAVSEDTSQLQEIELQLPTSSRYFCRIRAM